MSAMIRSNTPAIGDGTTPARRVSTSGNVSDGATERTVAPQMQCDCAEYASTSATPGCCSMRLQALVPEHTNRDGSGARPASANQARICSWFGVPGM